MLAAIGLLAAAVACNSTDVHPADGAVMEGPPPEGAVTLVDPAGDVEIESGGVWTPSAADV